MPKWRAEGNSRISGGPPVKTRIFFRHFRMEMQIDDPIILSFKGEIGNGSSLWIFSPEIGKTTRVEKAPRMDRTGSVSWRMPSIVAVHVNTQSSRIENIP